MDRKNWYIENVWLRAFVCTLFSTFLTTLAIAATSIDTRCTTLGECLESVVDLSDISKLGVVFVWAFFVLWGYNFSVFGKKSKL